MDVEWVFGGLPLHSLLVHFTVIAIPAAALAVLVSAVWPAAQRRLGLATPVLALLALIAVPLTVSAGEWLYERIEHTPAAMAHEAIGRSILPWAIALFIVAVLQWVWLHWGEKWRGESGFAARRGVRITLVTVLTVLAVVAAVGAVITVVIIGEAGTTSVWQGNFDN